MDNINFFFTEWKSCQFNRRELSTIKLVLREAFPTRSNLVSLSTVSEVGGWSQQYGLHLKPLGSNQEQY